MPDDATNNESTYSEKLIKVTQVSSLDQPLRLTSAHDGVLRADRRASQQPPHLQRSHSKL